MMTVNQLADSVRDLFEVDMTDTCWTFDCLLPLIGKEFGNLAERCCDYAYVDYDEEILKHQGGLKASKRNSISHSLSRMIVFLVHMNNTLGPERRLGMDLVVAQNSILKQRKRLEEKRRMGSMSERRLKEYRDRYGPISMGD